MEFAVKLIKAVSGRRRREILNLLVKHPGGMSVSELTKLCKISHPSCTFHVRRLRQAGLIKAVNDIEDARRVKYIIARGALDRIKQMDKIAKPINP
jgi:DNA-binding transcriptional ArsR family regulator